MDNKEIEAIFRKHFKQIRVKNECKLETLAKALNISTSYLSQWENNKRDLSEELVNEMFKFFKISDEGVRTNFKKNLNTLYLCYLDILYIKSTNRFKEFEKNLPVDFSESMEYPYYLVIYYLYNCKKPDEKLQAKIDKYTTLLSDDFIGIYYLAIGCAHTNGRDYSGALIFYQEGLKITTDTYITSLLHFNYGNTLLKCLSVSKALSEITTAKALFDECLAINRSIAAMNSLGIINLSSFNVDKAIEIFIKTKNLCDYLDIHILSSGLTNNLVWVYLIKDNYKESLFYAEILLHDHNRRTSCSYFYILYNLMHLNRLNEYRNYFEEYKLLCDSKDIIPDFHHGLIELINIFWIEKKSKRETYSKILSVIEEIRKEGTIEMNLLTLDFIIDYYKHNKNYKKCNEFLLYKDKLVTNRR